MSRICCLLAALLLSVCLFELRAEPAPQLRFQHVSSMNGLNQNSITSLYQDKAGILWIGTQDGLHSYNGIEFTLFQHDPTTARHCRIIMSPTYCRIAGDSCG